MLHIVVKKDLSDARRLLGGLAAEAPRATARAMNDTGFIVRKAIQAEMRKVFDRPTPWALNAYIVVKATPSRLTMMVSAQERADKSVRALAFLGPQIAGGRRLPKRSEIRLRQAGILFPDEFAVPGDGADIDEKTGNMKPSQIVKILSQVRAHHDRSQNTKIGAKTEYFYVHDRIKGIRAIWRRRPAGTVIPALMFVRAPFYSPRFDPHWVAERTIAEVWPRELSRQLGAAIARAR